MKCLWGWEPLKAKTWGVFFLVLDRKMCLMFQLRIAALVSILSLLDINIKVDSSGRPCKVV